MAKHMQRVRGSILDGDASSPAPACRRMPSQHHSTRSSTALVSRALARTMPYSTRRQEGDLGWQVAAAVPRACAACRAQRRVPRAAGARGAVDACAHWLSVCPCRHPPPHSCRLSAACLAASSEPVHTGGCAHTRTRAANANANANAHVNPDAFASAGPTCHQRASVYVGRIRAPDIYAQRWRVGALSIAGLSLAKDLPSTPRRRAASTPACALALRGPGTLRV